ncbi:aminopeptidase P family protein [Profundibacterium mesophilum]|uniref:Xaa-Pro aminopeptidase 2 n=1 Tax=Profundibacterium mesophilum KAUST100406-0324 TaxID=1037889 RepID=A0A921TCV1_9RHOB|nr:aminopeptidase P family protein [Profundibacterium mesophilum]KAF0677565.1 Xaa-Pro aminopeptidase 2 [Profundibacterium mesophilum KAUST100406-0324]
MFQSFDAATTPDQGPPRLTLLREQMAREGLDAYLVPRSDAHQGEYVAPHDERLAWLTGFTGSAGFCIVLAGEAGLFVDGRYTVQARAQVAAEITPVPWPATRPGAWLAERLGEGARVGFDPWLHSVREIGTLRAALADGGIGVIAAAGLVDRIWEDQPEPPRGKAHSYPDALAGRSAGEKRAMIAGRLADVGAAALLITLPDNIAWLLNIRGSDIPRTPVAHGFAMLRASGPLELFMDGAKLEGLGDHLGDQTAIMPPDGLVAALSTVEGPVWIDPASAPYATRAALEEAGTQVHEAPDPVLLAKAAKTPAEISATREAHLRDGAAMCRFLRWLDETAERVVAGARVTEIDVVRALEGFREETGALRDISFETIAGSGPNGAIVHYRVSHDSDRALAAGELLLVDSGGQYEDGTTDITRTVPIGTPGAEEVECATLVLRGMIALSTARWPRGLAGRDLDALARAPLWRSGRDYDHGTGHGVGVFLGVHEGPQRISKLGEVPLEPGMILSNEPGYYREGAFGIRIENLIAVEEAQRPDGGDARDMLCFFTLTLAPIDTRLVDAQALSREERDWLNGYHASLPRLLGDRLDPETRRWLEEKVRPI